LTDLPASSKKAKEIFFYFKKSSAGMSIAKNPLKELSKNPGEFQSAPLASQLSWIARIRSRQEAEDKKDLQEKNKRGGKTEQTPTRSPAARRTAPSPTA
jgi:hypothetical protein